MGVGVRSPNSRLRTSWTAEMDQYFIDLMLEQVGKENRRDDHFWFSKRAWKHMTTMFNAKFNSKYEKDVLKNRHKMLRNLYKALKNILEQKGFRWDESKQMVTADNRVWDDYIQAHPGARPYRVKKIPYYSDLFKIYGTVGIGGKGTVSSKKANANENMSRAVFEHSSDSFDDMLKHGCVRKIGTESLHDIMIDEDYRTSIAMVDETYNQFLPDSGSTAGARTRTYWQPPMDRYFIDLMLDQVKKGNHVDGLLRKQAWREMISSFNAKFGFEFAVDILKNRYKTLRRQHNVIKNFLELDGFAWDDARQMVVAEDCVWQNYIKAHTDARQYMTRPFPYYKALCSIFRELNGDERDPISSHQNLEIPNDNPEIKFITANQSPDASMRRYDLFPKENEPSSHSDFDIITVSPSLMDKKRDDENANTIPVEVVVAEIQALPDMDEELVLDACDFLEDEKKAKTFLALDVKLRRKWLMRKLRPSL